MKNKKHANAEYEQASPTLLSMQPNELTKKPKISDEDLAQWNALRLHCEARLIMLRQWRNSWWMQNWSSLANFILPRRSIWLTQSAGGIPTPNNMIRGVPINSAIKDPTGTFAARVCAAGMMSGLASNSRQWFKVMPKAKNLELDAEGRAWLDEIENRLYTVLAASNFYNSFAQECEDLVIYGTAPVIIYEDEQDIIRLYNPTIGEYYLASGATLRIDGLYRQFVMTIAEIVDFFTLEKCPEQIQSLWRQKGASLDKELIIAHSIEPNFDGPHFDKIPGGFTWREVYWLYGQASKQPLSIRGFVEQPFTAARWATQSNDAYGRSPGMDVLPDIAQLQVMAVRLGEAIEKQVRPPLLADVNLKNQPSSILPGQVTYVSDLSPARGMRPVYEVNPDIRGMEGLIASIQQRVKVGLFNDLFLMLEQSPDQRMTAYEVSQKVQEKLQVLGPVVENIITESLRPKLERVYGIMRRKDMLPPMPESLKGIPLDIEFISMVSIAQKGAMTAGIERILALTGNMVAVDPDVRFVVDFDTCLREFNDLLANPANILRGPEAVEKLKQQMAQAQAQQQQQQNAAQQAQTISVGADAASTLANTSLGAGQSALSSLLGLNQ